MLQGILDVLTKIGDFFSSVVDFIVSIFQDLANFIKMLGLFVSKVPDWFSWLPAPAVALVITLIGTVVLLRVLGRD